MKLPLHNRMIRLHRAALLLGALALAACSGPPTSTSDRAVVATPTLTEVAVTPTSRPFGSRADQIAAAGQIEREFLQSGRASVYAPGADGLAVPRDTDVPYTTRFIVRMPQDPARFSGTVWVELLNPTARYDQDVFGALSMEHFLRRGDIYVGLMVKPVSARTIAANYDPKNSPRRYAALSFPNPRPGLCTPPGNGATSFMDTEDGLAWDIISQTSAALRSRSGPLAGYKVQRIFASGYSQTANYLATYINTVLPTLRRSSGRPVYDGYLLGARTGNWTPIHQCAPVVPREAPQQVLRDAGVPVINVNTETDVPGTAVMRRTDDARFRLWELAGAGHSSQDSRSRTTADRDFKDTPFPALSITCVNKITTFPARYSFNAAHAALERWVRDRQPPASVERLGFQDNAITRDALGNALGGVRLPAIEVPVARFEGSNKFAGQGANFCFLLGSETPLTAAQLQALYPTQDVLVQKTEAAARNAVARGLLEPEDAAELVARARSR